MKPDENPKPSYDEIMTAKIYNKLETEQMEKHWLHGSLFTWRNVWWDKAKLTKTDKPFWWLDGINKDGILDLEEWFFIMQCWEQECIYFPREKTYYSLTWCHDTHEVLYADATLLVDNIHNWEKSSKNTQWDLVKYKYFREVEEKPQIIENEENTWIINKYRDYTIVNLWKAHSHNINKPEELRLIEDRIVEIFENEEVLKVDFSMKIKMCEHLNLIKWEIDPTYFRWLAEIYYEINKKRLANSTWIKWLVLKLLWKWRK